MTRTRNETTEEPTPVEEPEPVEEPTGEPDEDEQEEQSAAEAASEDGSAYIARKLEEENARHIEECGVILGIDVAPITCQKCFGSGLSDLPLTVYDIYKADPTKVACPNCDAKGQLATPSLVDGQQTVVCIQCSGLGWVTRQEPAPNVVQFTPQPQQTPAPAPSVTYGYSDADGVFHPWTPTGTQ